MNLEIRLRECKDSEKEGKKRERSQLIQAPGLQEDSPEIYATLITKI